MNDDLTPKLPELDDDQALAVAAVVDGTADAGQRALVDADPQLVGWVEAQRASQRLLRDVVVPAAARDAAVAAALAAFDDLAASTSAASASAASAPVSAAPPAAPLAPVTSITSAASVTSITERVRRRFEPRRMLAAAAAIVAVLAVGGVVVSQLDGGSGDDDATVAPASATAATSGALERSSMTADELAPAGADAAESGPSDQEPVVAADQLDQLDEAATGPAEDASGGASMPQQTISQIPGAADVESAASTLGDDAATGSGTGGGSVDPDAATAPSVPATISAPVEVVTDAEALADYVARAGAAGAPNPAEPPDTVPSATCPEEVAATDEVLGYVGYGPEAIPAVVVRAAGADGRVSVLDLATCELLASLVP